MDAGRDEGEHAEADDRRRRWFEALVERGSDLALICDRDIAIRYAGPSLRTLFGYDPEEVVGVSGWDFVHPDDVDRAQEHFRTVVGAPGRHPAIEVRVRHRDGSWRWIEEQITNLLDDPVVGGIVVNIRDITDRRQTLEELGRREQLLSAMFQATQEGIWAVDTAERTLFANAQMAEMLGVPHDALLAGGVSEVLTDHTREVVRSHLATRSAGVSSRYELLHVRPDGEQRWLLVSGAPLTDPAGDRLGVVGMAVDITDRKRDEEQLARLALYDTLTGLPNRALMSDRLGRLLDLHARTGAGVAVLFCDVDRFKLVNDGGGHATGDQLLTQVAGRLGEAVRDQDTVARFGGDEFVVLCPGADTYVARRVAADVLAAFEAPFDLDRHPVSIGVSIGVAAVPDVPGDSLLQAADRALYRAKSAGRGRVAVYDPTLHESAEHPLQLLTDIRAALSSDTLEMNYQPIVGTDGTVRSVEALLRWTHPERGPISPAVVVEVAEQNGLIGALGAWTLERACRDIAGSAVARRAGVSVAVNVSTMQLAEPGFATTVRTVLHRTGLSPRRLILEITETSLLAGVQRVRPLLDELTSLGVRLTLDDFGTGYSSLTYLRQFPVDGIKIDRSFVAGVTENRDDLAIVASLVNLAATVGLDVVAEGVETAAQADLLRRLGCTAGQGFLWSPAVRLADLEAQLRRGAFPVTPTDDAHRLPAVRSGDGLQEQARILALHRGGASPTTIAAALNAEGLRTAQGTRWHRNTVARVIAESAYPELRLPAV